MKLVEILANELSEWPCDGPATQDPDKEIRFDRPGFDFFANSLADDAGADIGEGVEVTREMWQAERDRQKGGEWKRHRGGWMPTGLAGMVEVKLRCGDIQRADSHALLWRHEDCDVAANIMKYRVISQPQAEEVEMIHSQESLKRVEINLMGITEGTFTQGPISLDNEVIYPAGPEWHTDQIDGPILWRDTVNELDAYIEEFTRERDELIERLASEGFALIPDMTAVMGVADVDIGDWRNWKAGDIVECLTDSYSGVYTKGQQYKVKSVNRDDFDVFDNYGESSSCVWDDSDCDGLKFIRRP